MAMEPHAYLTSIGRRKHECHTVCEKRLQSQSGPWVESPRGRRGHSLPRSSNLPSHCTSEPWTRQRSAARTTTLAALDSRVAHRDVRGKSVCSSFDFVQIGCLSGSKQRSSRSAPGPPQGRKKEAQRSAPGPPQGRKPPAGEKGVRGLPASGIMFVSYTAAFLLPPISTTLFHSHRQKGL